MFMLYLGFCSTIIIFADHCSLIFAYYCFLEVYVLVHFFTDGKLPAESMSMQYLYPTFESRLIIRAKGLSLWHFI